MRSFAAAMALATASFAQQSLFETIKSADSNLVEATDANLAEPVTHNISKNKFGCLVEEKIYEHPLIEKKITAPLVPYHMDYV